MKEQPIKNHPTIACCGIDCGLCPTFYTKGHSKCPGCCGPGFSDKHPSCSIVTCCVKKNKFETCGECTDFPCTKIAKWDLVDSFVSHRKSLTNLNFIKENGINKFLENQKKRIEILEKMLDQFNDGRSKSFYCIATALLSISNLENALKTSEKYIKMENIPINDLKSKSKNLKSILNNLAIIDEIELKLRKK